MEEGRVGRADFNSWAEFNADALDFAFPVTSRAISRKNFCSKEFLGGEEEEKLGER